MIGKSSHPDQRPAGGQSTETIKEAGGGKLIFTNAAGEELTWQRPEGRGNWVPSEKVWDNFFTAHEHILLVCEFEGEVRKPEGAGAGRELNIESTIIKAFKGPGTMGQRIRHSLYSDGFGKYEFVPGTLSFVFVDGDLAKPLTVETGGGFKFSKQVLESAEHYVRKFRPQPEAGKSPPAKN